MHTQIDMNSIDTIFLDMDGTLLDLHYDNHFWQDFLPQRYAQYHQIDLERANKILVPKFKAHEGTLNWYCLDFWSNELKMDIASMKEEVAHLIDIHDGVIEFLEAMQATEKRIILLTNAHRKVLELKMRYTLLEVKFDALISSHDLGLPKEHPDFWSRLEEIEKFEPDRTLFVDDSLPVLRSAQQYGVKYLLTIYQPSSKEAPRDIKEFPVLRSFTDLIP